MDDQSAFIEFQKGQEAIGLSGQDLALQQATSSNAITPRETLDFHLQVEGDTRLMELATPLLGLSARVRSLEDYENVPELYARTRNDIQNFTIAMENAGYDRATIMAARYCLCSMVDESVMGQSWGADSIWPENPMLSIFHNETWGGEKFFAVLDRVLNDAKRFPDLLEFLYMCLLLGFEGKYHVMPNGAVKLNQLQRHVGREIVEIKGQPAPIIPDAISSVKPQTGQLGFQLPVRTILIAGLAVLTVGYAIYAISLSSEIGSISESISNKLSVISGEVGGSDASSS